MLRLEILTVCSWITPNVSQDENVMNYIDRNLIKRLILIKPISATSGVYPRIGNKFRQEY
jgi:hypothetical protein